MFDTTPRDTTPVLLDEDKKAVLTKSVRHCSSGLHTILEFGSKGILDAELCRNVLTTTEHELAKISKLIGVDIETTANIERRHASIRAANMRIHELEAQLGKGVTAAHLQQGMRRFSKLLDSWWKSEGFGHISEQKFSDYGACEVTFSCMLFGSTNGMFSQTPVSDKERKAMWEADLATRGFVLMDSRHDREAIVDCDASRQVLARLFALRLPSARIVSYTNWGETNELFSLRDVKVFIRDLAEIETLPQLPGPAVDD